MYFILLKSNKVSSSVRWCAWLCVQLKIQQLRASWSQLRGAACWSPELSSLCLCAFKTFAPLSVRPCAAHHILWRSPMIREGGLLFRLWLHHPKARLCFFFFFLNLHEDALWHPLLSDDQPFCGILWIFTHSSYLMSVSGSSNNASSVRSDCPSALPLTLSLGQAGLCKSQLCNLGWGCQLFLPAPLCLTEAHRERSW